MKEIESDKPPLSLCNIVTSRVHSSSNDRSIARRREMAFIQHLSSPDLRFRLRNDLVILAPDGLLSL